MGLAYPSLSAMDHDGFFTSAINQGAVKSSVFAFRLSKNNSELYLGGTNAELYDGPIEYHSVEGDTTGYWQIGGGSISVGGEDVPGELSAVIEYVLRFATVARIQLQSLRHPHPPERHTLDYNKRNHLSCPLKM
jgi:hypothetical protein